MRTIIINTLGSELRQNPLFYLPFREDQFHWMEHSLEGIDTCVQEICDYANAQSTHQDSHLVILVSLACYPLAQFQLPRQAYKDILFAHLNRSLLYPLVQECRQPLKAVSVIFVLPQPVDGTNGIPADDVNLHVLGVDPTQPEIPALALTDENGNRTVDLTPLFSEALSDYRTSLENAALYDSTLTHRGAMDTLKQAINDRLRILQTCKYLLPGEETAKVLATEQLDFYPRTTDWDLFCVDLQINLSDHLAAHLSDGHWKLALKPHTSGELRSRISAACSRVKYLQQQAPSVNFFALENQPFEPLPTDISLEIWNRLNGEVALPGVQDAQAFFQDPTEETKETKKTTLGSKLYLKWLLIGHARKSFLEQCDQLEAQYEPETAEKQQSAIFDICASVFQDWRRKVLTRQQPLPEKATEPQLPQFDSARHQQALAEAQQEWGKASAEQLADYTDVRQEAEKLKADFRKAYRLWPDGEFNATSKFFLYSLVLAAVFLLQMLVPYIGITMTQEGVALSRYVHFFLSLGVFAVLYGVGVLFWMTALCRQLNGYTRQMYNLLQKSHRRRRDSIVRAVDIYGRILPKCAVCYEQLQELRELHETNLQRKERYNTHAQILSKADELLGELLTLLRMPMEPTAEPVKLKGHIDYQSPPSDPVNVPYYIFMCEKWGC